METKDCIGCGYCCTKSMCRTAAKIHGISHEICPELEWNGERHICKLAETEHSKEIEIDSGCPSSLNTWRSEDLRDRLRERTNEQRRAFHEARKTVLSYYFIEVAEGKWQYREPTEFDQELNDYTRYMIDAFKELFGKAWLGKINRYSEDKSKSYLVEYTGQKIFNFEYHFIIPRYDLMLVTLIRRRENSEYQGTNKDAKRVDKILERIEALAGYSLSWV